MTGDDNHDGNQPETSNPSQPIPPPTSQLPHTVSSIKLPILKKGEYDIWAMKMEHYLCHTNYPIWRVIQNGNGPVSVTTYTNGMIKVLPPKTAKEVVARERERKARTTLLMALPEDHLAKFHKMDDAKEMWEAIKSRFSGSDEFMLLGNQDSRRRDTGYNGNKARDTGRRPTYHDDSKALVTIDGEDIDWSRHVEEDTQNYAMMAYSSSNSSSDNEIQSCSKTCGESYARHKKLYDEQRDKLDDASIEITSYTLALKKTSVDKSDAKTSENATCEFDTSVETTTSMPVTIKDVPKVVSEPKVWTDAPIIEEYELDSDDDSVYNVQENIETPSFTFTDSVKHVKTPRENVKETGTPNHFCHIIRDCDFHEKRMAKHVTLTKSQEKVTGQQAHRPVWNNVKRVNHQNKFVPSVLLTKTGKIPINAARQNFSRQAALTSAASKVNTARPFVNETRPTRCFVKSHSPYKMPFHNKTAQRNTFANHKVNVVNTSLSTVKGNRDTAVKASAGNKAYLADYQDFMGGSVAFGGSNGRITGKGKIKASRLDFEDVYYVEELKHYNLFSMSKMCDKKNKVLFTNTDCLVLSLDFKLPDKNQLLLKIPRQHNMYSFNLKNIDPFGDLSCLFAKASIDKSNKWHRRLGHVNFKNLNKLMKGNLVRGLPSKIFENDHTCVACQKGKQHKAFCPQETNNSTGTQVIDDQGANLEEIDLNEEHFVLPIWSAYSTTVKSLGDKIEKNEKPDAKTNSTNLLTIVNAPVSAVGPLKDLNDDEPSYPDDPSMPHLEDIFASPREGIFTNSSYDDEDLPFEKKAIGTKWVYTNKKDERGVMIEAIRILLAFASYMGLIVYQMDVKSSFMYGIINEEVYVTQPPGFVDLKFPNKLYKVLKALYGLHQAPRAWYATLSTFLEKK
nr:ribonuclease H-like domain-containing protein [Tanacetum cinerariifolium]